MVSTVKTTLPAKATTAERLSFINLPAGSEVFDTDLNKSFITISGGASPTWDSINNTSFSEVISSATSVATFVVASGGTGYVNGDFVEPTGGSATINAKLKVVAVGGSGNILAVALVPDQSNSGFYVSNPSPLVANPVTAVTGSGVNATITFTMKPAGTVTIDPNNFNAMQFNAEHGYIGLPNIPVGFEDSVTMNEGGIRYLQRTDALEYRDDVGNRRVMSDLDVPLAVKGDLVARGSFQNEAVPIGQNDKVLTASGEASNGVAWKDVPRPAQFSQIITKTVAASDVEESIIGGGFGSLTFPENYFVQADSFHFKSGGNIRTNGGGQTIRIKIKTDTAILADTGFITLTSIASLQFYEMELDFVVRNIGVAGVAEVATNGNFNYQSTIGGGNFEGAGINFFNSTTFDTEIENTIELTVQWGIPSVLNVISSNFGSLEQKYRFPS